MSFNKAKEAHEKLMRERKETPIHEELKEHSENEYEGILCECGVNYINVHGLCDCCLDKICELSRSDEE